MNAADKFPCQRLKLVLQFDLRSLWEGNRADWEAIVGGVCHQDAIADRMFEDVAGIIAAYLLAIGGVEQDVGSDTRENDPTQYRAGHSMMWRGWRK